MNSAAPARAAARSTAALGAPGSPSAMFSATDQREQRGVLRQPADLTAPHDPAAMAARPAVPTVIDPPAGARNLSSTARMVDFPAPFGPVSVIRSPGLIVRSRSSMTGLGRPG